jgi:hypothetical protein
LQLLVPVKKGIARGPWVSPQVWLALDLMKSRMIALGCEVIASAATGIGTGALPFVAVALPHAMEGFQAGMAISVGGEIMAASCSLSLCLPSLVRFGPDIANQGSQMAEMSDMSWPREEPRLACPGAEVAVHVDVEMRRLRDDI